MKRLLGLILFAVLTGCATGDTVANRDDAYATSRLFDATYPVVTAATIESMQNLNINLKGTDQGPDRTTITFTKSMSAWSWGEVGKVVVKSHEEGTTIVSVSTAKRYKLQVTGTKEEDFAEAIFSGITEAL